MPLRRKVAATFMFGVPQEAFGFSDARGRFGPTDFEEAAFTLGSNSLSMTPIRQV